MLWSMQVVRQEVKHVMPAITNLFVLSVPLKIFKRVLSHMEHTQYFQLHICFAVNFSCF